MCLEVRSSDCCDPGINGVVEVNGVHAQVGVFRPDDLITCKDIIFSGIPDFFKIMAVVIAVESKGDVLVPG